MTTTKVKRAKMASPNNGWFDSPPPTLLHDHPAVFSQCSTSQSPIVASHIYFKKGGEEMFASEMRDVAPYIVHINKCWCLRFAREVSEADNARAP